MTKKTIMKRWLVLSVMIISSLLSAHAQHFDWVKTYTSSDDNNKICGTDVDSKGNVYIIGEFRPGARIDGTELLPMEPYGPYHNTISVVIAKLSADGTLLWHKAIHSNNNQHTKAIGIQCMGDTSVVCMADMNLPGGSHYTYFLDTLLPTYESGAYLMPIDSIMNDVMTVWMRFSEDGELQEKHLLSISYTDTAGRDIKGDRLFRSAPQYASRYANWSISIPNFTFDNEGNIILIRNTYDHLYAYCDTCEHSSEWSVENGLLSGYKILVDGGLKQHYWPVSTPTSNQNRQVMKFSPHFDSLLGVAYYFTMSPEENAISDASLASEITSVKTDSRNNIYVTGHVIPESKSYENAFDLAVANSDSLSLRVEQYDYYKPFCIKFDKDLAPKHLIQLRETNSNTGWSMISAFGGIEFDEDSNLIILGQLSGQSGEQKYFYDSIELNADQTGLCFLRIDTTWGLLSYGNASTGSGIGRNCLQFDFSMKNNRIVTQMRFEDELTTIDSVYTTPTISHGILTWDYDGHCISFVDYQSSSYQTTLGGAILHDNALYVSGMFVDGATMQGFTIPNSSNGAAYIARYVDSAFRTPYVYEGDTTGGSGGGSDTGNVSITLVENGTAWVAYPNPFRQRVNISYGSTEAIASAYLTDMQGRREEVRLMPQGNGHYSLDLTGRPQATYLLTLITSTGKTHTIRLLKQGDIFSR